MLTIYINAEKSIQVKVRENNFWGEKKGGHLKAK